MTEGSFESPWFLSEWAFGKDNLAEFFNEKRALDVSDPLQANYTAFDLARTWSGPRAFPGLRAARGGGFSLSR